MHQSAEEAAKRLKHQANQQKNNTKDEKSNELRTIRAIRKDAQTRKDCEQELEKYKNNYCNKMHAPYMEY